MPRELNLGPPIELPPTRKPMSKRLRFEIFKRDAFTCQYCGRRPPDVVLEVDHIHPVAAGGDNDEMNLISSCDDCNRGKAAKVLTERIIRPDADLRYLEAQQELAEAKRFLAVKAELDQCRRLLIAEIQRHWHRVLSTGDDVPADQPIMQWLSFYTPEQIITAIDRSAPAINGRPWTFKRFDNYIRYVSGVLRGQREQEEYRLA